MRKAILFMAVAAAMLWLGSSLDKEALLHDCVQQTEGTDADCEQCYYKVYGTYPNP